MFKTSLSTGNILIEIKGKKLLRLVSTYNLGKQVELQSSFELSEVAEAEERTWELANIIFSLLAQAKAVPPPTAQPGPQDHVLKEELKAAKAEIQRLQERVSGLETDLI